jgi:hypothetical protein
VLLFVALADFHGVQYSPSAPITDTRTSIATVSIYKLLNLW